MIGRILLVAALLLCVLTLIGFALGPFAGANLVAVAVILVIVAALGG